MKPIHPTHGENSGAPNRPTTRLTLCVDDFGLHEGVNTSVLTLFAMGRLGATSVLVDGMATRAGAEILIDATKRSPDLIDVGLHLNLSEPLGESLQTEHSPESGFRCVRLPSLILSSYGRLLNARTMQLEIHRQFAAFEKIFGRRPDHVDGHQHVHQLPVVRDALINVLTTRYGWDRPWIRRTRPARGTRVLKAHIIAALGERALTAMSRLEGYAQNRHLLGVHEFTSDALVYQDRLGQWLREAVDGDLLMCHPGTWTPTPDLLMNQRMAEHEVLTGAGFERQLAAAGVVLARLATKPTARL